MEVSGGVEVADHHHDEARPWDVHLFAVDRHFRIEAAQGDAQKRSVRKVPARIPSRVWCVVHSIREIGVRSLR